jgi:ParB family transcriptional regulator, chromosome partitioning protein
MPLRLDDLAALDTPIVQSGQPLMLPIDSIDEDPEQPRREFDAHALQELAQTVRERGVKQPISVRPNAHVEGRWLLNFGARRLRASRLAGLTEVPAFIDCTGDSYDQIVENEQREALRPLEVSLFVQRRLQAGDSQAEIARRLGRSRQYVTLARALIEPPDWLMQAYRDGRCTSMTELYELRRLYGDYPERVEAWARTKDHITREDLPSLRAQLEEAECLTLTPNTSPEHEPNPVDESPSTEPAAAGKSLRLARGRPQASQRLHVEMDGVDYQLVVTAAPTREGHLYIRPLAGGPRMSAPAASLKLLGFVAG